MNSETEQNLSESPEGDTSKEHPTEVKLDLPEQGRPPDEHFLFALEDVLWMHCNKGADYGSSDDHFANVRGSEQFGIDAWLGAVVRANDKMERLKTFTTTGTLVNESVEDSLLDLANYALIALTLYREKFD